LYGIKEVPKCILNLPKLKRIETRGYNINHLPSLVAKQYELNMKECLRRIERCKKLKLRKLDLSYLYIGKLPKELSDLYWLEELDLTSNDLKQLPEQIGNLRKLTTLDLDCNELTFLSDSIGNLSKLKKIRLI
jgi:Leucine-rich repeat (LRR) protein